MISIITSLPDNDDSIGLNLEVVSQTLLIVLGNFTDKVLQTYVFPTFNEDSITSLYNRVVSFLEYQRKISPEVFIQSQLCSQLLTSLEKICRRYLTYKRSALKCKESPEDGEDTPIKNVARPFLLQLVKLSPNRAQSLAEDYAEFNTLYYLCETSFSMSSPSAIDFEMFRRFVQKWPQFEYFVYGVWLRDYSLHKYFFDSRLESRRLSVREFLCREENVSELTTTFLLEFYSDDREVLGFVVDNLLLFAQKALFSNNGSLDALDFAVTSKMLLIANSVDVHSLQYVLSAFIEVIITSQSSKKGSIELDPAKILSDVLLAENGEDGDEGDRDRKCDSLRSALDFVNLFGLIVDYSARQDYCAERFVNAYCRYLGDDSYKNRSKSLMDLCKIVFANAFAATDWEKVEGMLGNSNRNEVLSYLNESPIMDLGRYAFFKLGMPKEFICEVVHDVTNGKSLVSAVFDLGFTKYEPPAFVNNDDNVDNDDDEIMEEEDDEDNY